MFLFDENLAPQLVGQLSDLYPGSAHVRNAGLLKASDWTVRQYASDNGLAIVSRDRDMQILSYYYGHPPKVIWLCVGNASTAHIEAVLRGRHTDVLAFLADPVTSFLTLA